MSDVVTGMKLVPNPSYAGKTPRPLLAACHDRTPFLTAQCDCGYQLHLHESQLATLPDHAIIETRCHACGGQLVFPPHFFEDAFQQLRDEGWLAERGAQA